VQFDKPLGVILCFDDNTYDNNGSCLQEMHTVDCPCNFRIHYLYVHSQSVGDSGGMTLKNAGTDQISALCIYFYRIAEFLCPSESNEDIRFLIFEKSLNF
jgi:hypothetical protein